MGARPRAQGTEGALGYAWLQPDCPTMDLRRIRHFVVLAETLNFRRAAERLHMAQPPLTVSIQKLEAELGTKLFERGTQGVTLTAIGRTVLVEARKLLFHGTQLGAIARSALEGTVGTLHVGFVGTTTYGMLQKVVPRFHSEYPGVELMLHEATSVAILQQLEDHGWTSDWCAHRCCRPRPLSWFRWSATNSSSPCPAATPWPGTGRCDWATSPPSPS